MHFRKTKIVCTIGPACENQLEKMIAAGMDVARFNMSHGTHEDHLHRLKLLRAAAEKAGKRIAVVADIQGPKIRVGIFPNGGIELREGELINLVAGRGEGGAMPQGKNIYINYPRLLETLAQHKLVYFSDGLLEVKVEKIEKDHAVARVVTGGTLSDLKGVSIPNARLDQPTFGGKDWKDVEWAVANDVDYIAQSFVRTAKDVTKLRKLLQYYNGEKTKIIAKIEDATGLENIEAIIAEADAVMVARGDLGVQIPFEDVPRAQKTIIAKCGAAGKPVITATQMLESMTASPSPTRAEVSDVANAILDGSDAVMLSGETAFGKYPVRAVEAMAKIAAHVEQRLLQYSRQNNYCPPSKNPIPRAIASAVCATAERISATAIAAFTETGSTAFLISSLRPRTSIIAVTPSEKTARQLALCWGTQTLVVKEPRNADEAAQYASRALLENKLVAKNDLVIIAAGLPFGGPRNTNFIKIVRAQ
ncbi:MAG: pyruvate kinase [Candidatus Micrarchaeia archaeon]